MVPTHQLTKYIRILSTVMNAPAGWRQTSPGTAIFGTLGSCESLLFGTMEELTTVEGAGGGGRGCCWDWDPGFPGTQRGEHSGD